MGVTPLTLAMQTDPGRVRTTNEDSALARVLEEGRASPEAVRAVLAVADGMGGHQAGEVASQLAVRLLEKVFTTLHRGRAPGSLAELAGYLRDTVRWINQEVRQLADPAEERRPGTTLSLVLVRGDEFALAHVGDTRVYHYREQQLTLLTDDHSYVAEQVRAGRMTEELAAQSPFRGQLTRCLGQQTEIEVDLRTGTLQPGDRLLVCSDGVNEYVTDDEIAAVLARVGDLDEVCQELISLALERGGGDNITVVVGQAGSPVLSRQLSSAERQARTMVMPRLDAAAAQPVGAAGPDTRRLKVGLTVGVILAGLLFGGALGRFSAGRRAAGGQPERPAPAATASAPRTSAAGRSAGRAAADAPADAGSAAPVAGQPQTGGQTAAPGPEQASRTSVVTIRGDGKALVLSSIARLEVEAVKSRSDRTYEVTRNPDGWHITGLMTPAENQKSWSLVSEAGTEQPLQLGVQTQVESGTYTLKGGDVSVARFSVP